MRGSIKKVAELSGCSITTVSRCFTNPEKVKEQTRLRILQAARQCGYAPNVSAQALVRQRNHTLAFVVHQDNYPLMKNPFYADIYEAVQQESQKLGYSVYLTSGTLFHSEAQTMLSSRRVDGTIFAGKYEAVLLDFLYQQKLPVALINAPSPYPDVPCVTADDYKGTVTAVEHLISLGHSKIGLVAGELFSYISGIRQKAFLDTMGAHGLPILPNYIQHTTPDISTSMKAVSKMLQVKDPPTALFCMNDAIAVGAVKAALRHGLRIPQELAVVGYDNSNLCSVIEPELTSISVATQEMGKHSVQLLDQVINNIPIETYHLVLKTELVKRNST